MAEQVQINLSKVMSQLLLLEASRWVTIREQGTNKGQMVELFQKAVDGKAQGEPWCMAYVQYCVKMAYEQFNISHPHVAGYIQNVLYPSEHCLTVWNKTPVIARTDKPYPGCLVIWRYGNTTNGHVGIIREVSEDMKTLYTFEGNTGAGVGVVREGDGVYPRTRSAEGSGDMKVVGYLEPFVHIPGQKPQA